MNYGYSYPLSDFQKTSIQAVLDGKHSLITAATGSGKSLPAEYLINHFHKKGIKTIYTSPIKALSNQKYYDFQKKFPDIFFGLITGDIKCGPNADCIIMTCEILRNNLFRAEDINKHQDFEMDLEKELGLVIFDEVHYINDAERGTVWEETLIKLSELSIKRVNNGLAPIQFLMLSATIDNPENFANWITNISNTPVKISGTTSRVVPLRHYAFMTMARQKLIKDPQSRKLLNDNLNIPLVLKDETVQFYDNNYDTLLKVLKIIDGDNHSADHFTINEIVKYLKSKDLMPAIFFSLSRKNVMNYASMVEQNLHTESGPDSTVPVEHNSQVIRNDAYHIMSRLPNHKEYTGLTEYEKILTLLEKGVAYHHSGMLSIFRELVELMFEKGHVKLLFATETFSVGINLPTRAVVFDSLSKYDGHERRLLLSHEYTQMSGRAGRRGIDTIGYVFHLNSVFELPSRNEYKEILGGAPQTFSSKFKTDYSLILRSLIAGQSPELLSNKSTMSMEIEAEKKSLLRNLKNIEEPEIEEGLKKYIELKESWENNPSQNRRRAIQKEISKIENPEIIKKYTEYQNYLKKVQENKIAKQRYELLNTYTDNSINGIKDFLSKNSFIDEQGSLTTKGRIASGIQEVHPLILTELLEHTNNFRNYELTEILGILGTLFEAEEENTTSPFELGLFIETLYHKYNKETPPAYSNYDNIKEWILAKTPEECKIVFSGIYIGTFTKLILKLNNLVNELIRVIDDVEFKHKLSMCGSVSLKFMITNQSLYV